MRFNLLASLISAPLLASGAFAQGSNDCASAQVISGLGTFSFNNVGANTDGPFDCNGQPVRRDVWFRWVAPATGGYSFNQCGGTTLDTRIAVYDGVDCVNFPLIACMNSNCFNATRIPFAAIGGNEYLIRMGSRFVGPGGSGTFVVEPDPCPTQMPDGFEDNDLCSQATPLLDGTYQDLTVAKVDDDWYAFPVADGSTLQVDVLFTHQTGDLDIFLFDGCGGTSLDIGGTGSDDEVVAWTNNLGCDTTVYLRVEHFAPDTNADCNNYDMVVNGAGGTGSGCDPVTLFCDPANSNSTGVPVTLTASGSFDSTAPVPMHLEAVGGRPNLGAFFLISTGNSANTTISDGTLCLDAPQGRYNPAAGGSLNSLGFFDANGVLQNASGTSTIGSGFDVPGNLPNPPGGTIMSGSTWYFQLWYRDLNPSTVSNFSNGLAVTFN